MVCLICMTCPCKEHGLSEVPFFDGTRIFVPAAFLPEHFWLIRSFTEHGLTEVPFSDGNFVPYFHGTTCSVNIRISQNCSGKNAAGTFSVNERIFF
jgi:hypothetical protein